MPERGPMRPGEIYIPSAAFGSNGRVELLLDMMRKPNGAGWECKLVNRGNVDKLPKANLASGVYRTSATSVQRALAGARQWIEMECRQQGWEVARFDNLEPQPVKRGTPNQYTAYVDLRRKKA